MAKQTDADPGNNAELRRLRRLYQLTGRELADITGIALSTVNEWLSDRRPMPNRSMRLLKLEVGIERPAYRGVTKRSLLPVESAR